MRVILAINDQQSFDTDDIDGDVQYHPAVGTCHLLEPERYDMLAELKSGGVRLVNHTTGTDVTVDDAEIVGVHPNAETVTTDA